jgi:SAM-dependent methyltransferase
MSSLVRLNKFVDYSKQFIRGDEKSEAQPFLNEFFRAFGYEGARQAGAEFEYRVDKGSLKGNKGYADLVWKSRLLIEMKSRNENLKNHYSQVERYWMRLTPKPKYSILSNFDEFWIFDFNNQVDAPVDIIQLDELPKRAGAFNFMEHEDARPLFRNNQVEITERNARLMGELYQSLIKRAKQTDYGDFDKQSAQRFVLQCVLAMFAEDRDLLPQDMFVSCVRECIDGKGNTYDVLGGLFAAMNQKGVTPAGRYKGVEYFNGGLFATIHPIELISKELEVLENCAKQKWDQVRPSIFGSIFESAIDDKDRHSHGIHFTSEADIRQIVIPTITEYWESLIDAANSKKELHKLQQKLINYKVLDPACGSGNFLYIAYQELKKIEMKLLRKLSTYQKSDDKQLSLGFVSPNQFYGMDTNPFAVELARVTMMISRKVAIDDLELKDEPALPLDSLDKNIACKDALFSEWVKADAIIGNPPFLGGKHIRLGKSDDYVDRIFQRFSDVKDSVDYCCYWFRLTHDHLDENGRAGLVGTNSISQGKSRKASLEYITQNSGYIHNAISTQPWSGEAAVHVSLVNWSKQLPKNYHLDNQIVLSINSSLQSTIDVSQAIRLKANLNRCFQGVIPVGAGFVVTEQQVKDWIKADAKNQEVLKLFSMGANLAQKSHGKPERWIIDFNDLTLEDASDYVLPFAHIKTHVKPEREQNREAVMREKWWRFKRTNAAMRKAISPLSSYFTVPRVSKWAVFIPAPLNWLPGDKSVVVASDDFYTLGVLTSNVHRTWMNAQKSTLGTTSAYTHSTCFETFPFPQSPNVRLIEQIREVAIKLHQYRTEIMEKRQWGITKLYNAFFDEPESRLYKLHAKLDDLVMKAYEFKVSDDLLEKLLGLNLELAEKEDRGEHG